ncbi:MAG TPA: hypothetical protein PLI18_16975 [Pirellulaceae bacterium]|nr:hypothetical protein [Pirellulaceae bacterium]
MIARRSHARFTIAMLALAASFVVLRAPIVVAQSISDPVITPPPRTAKAPVRITIRFGWGGGRAALWQGSLRVSAGRIADFRPLGTSIDEPVAFRIEGRELRIEPLAPRVQDGVDLVLEGAAPETELILTLQDAAATQPPTERRFRLAELFAAPVDLELDAAGNRLNVARAPQDEILLEIDRPHLVFVPLERFDFRLSPVHIADQAESYPVEVRLIHPRTEQVISTWRAPEEAIDRGIAEGAPLPVSIAMPEAQGAYVLRIDLLSRRGANPFVRPRVVASRSIDLMVADRQGTDEPAPIVGLPRVGGLTLPVPRRLIPGVRESNGEWQIVHQIDPTSSSWIRRLQDLDGINLVKRFRTEPIGSRPLERESLDGRDWLTLAPGGWHAFPLPVEQRELPHRLSIEIAHGNATSNERLGVSVVEPDGDRTLASMEDLAFEFSHPDSVGSLPPWDRRTDSASLHFWPITRSPWVVVTNLSETESLRVGLITLSAGPQRLDETRSDPIVPATAASRLIGPYLPLPDLGSFDAERGQGEPAERAGDWYEFDRSVRRLIEHLHASGMNSAAITVAADGGAWFPSRTLRPSTRFDRGLAGRDGRDPLPKDRLELLLRRFDQAGLRLIPVLDLTAPLPEVEQARRERRDPDLDKIDERGESALRRRLANGDPRGYHDPTHDLVADAVVRAVAEFAERYGDHPSLAGVGLRIGPGSHLFFGGPGVGTSETNRSRFAAALGHPIDSFSPFDLAQGNLREDWLAWRSARMTALLARIESQVVAADPTRRLFLIGDDWYQGAGVMRRLHPTPRGREPDPSTAPLEIGIDPRGIERLDATLLVSGLGRDGSPVANGRRLEEVIWGSALSRSIGGPNNGVARATPGSANPRRTADRSMAERSASDRSGNDRTGVVRQVASAAERIESPVRPIGLAIGRPPRSTTLAELMPIVSAGRAEGNVVVNPPYLEAGLASRRLAAESLLLGDTLCLFDEGWGRPAVTEGAQREFLEILQRLPVGPYVTIDFEGATPTPVLLRGGTIAGRRWYYAVNAGPWPATLAVTHAGAGSIEAVGPSAVTLGATVDDPVTIELAPYALAAWSCAAPETRVANVRTELPAEATAGLQQELDRLLANVNGLGEGSARRVPVDNGDFEQLSVRNELPGWLVSSTATVRTESSDSAHEGTGVLRMESRGEVLWARSRPLPIPRSGRLSLKIQVRSRDPQRPAPLRLSLEAKTPDGGYYQFAPIGLGHGEGIGGAIGPEWTPFAVHFDDLPCDGVQELRVGFDLMGAGDLEIDGLEVLDGWFDDSDRKVLFQRISVARLQLQQGNLVGPYRLLEGYWPRVIMDAERLTRLAAESSAESAAEPTRSSRNVFDRVRDIVPTPRR